MVHENRSKTLLFQGQGNFKNVAMSVARRHQKLIRSIQILMTFLTNQLLHLLVRYCKFSSVCNICDFVEKHPSSLSQECDWIKGSITSHLPTLLDNDVDTAVVR